MVRRLLTISLVLSWAALARAQTPLKCAVCEQPITGQYHFFDSSALPEKKVICDACVHLENACFVCGLPVKLRYQALEDGRFLCEQDAKAAVFSSSEAQEVWEEVRRDIVKLFSGFGVLPASTTLSLVDQPRLSTAYNNQFSWHDKGRTLGLTQTRFKNQSELEHTIYVLNGLNRARLAAVCAHEFAHTWLNENVSRDRRLDGNTVEGFCELVAYKLMNQRDEAVEKKVILANGYTKGQIHILLQTDDSFQFYRLLDWFKNGVDDHLDKANVARVLQLKPDQSAVPALWAMRSAPTQVPDTLTLKGISGTGAHRFALINDCTLQKNEEGRVRVGKTNVVVRCLEISARSAIILPRGSKETIELSLRPDQETLSAGLTAKSEIRNPKSEAIP